jgi:hypothetical protein
LKGRILTLGTIEIGNGFPRDGEWKVAFRNAILTFKDGVLKLNTEEGETILPSELPGNSSAMVLRDTIAASARDDKPPTLMYERFNTS